MDFVFPLPDATILGVEKAVFHAVTNYPQSSWLKTRVQAWCSRVSKEREREGGFILTSTTAMYSGWHKVFCPSSDRKDVRHPSLHGHINFQRKDSVRCNFVFYVTLTIFVFRE
jgi:hypothetical protein